MKTDTYQRWSCIFLAVIALNLSLLTIYQIGFAPTRSERSEETTWPVSTQRPSERALRARSEEDVLPVRIAEVDPFIFGKLPVEVRNEALKVEVRNQPLDVRVR